MHTNERSLSRFPPAPGERMAEFESLEDYEEACDQCDRDRYVVYPDGDVARAEICEQCFENCPACHDERYTYVTDDRGYRYAKPCDVCGSLRQRVEAFNTAGIPARYYEKAAILSRFRTKTEAGRSIGNLRDVRTRMFEWVGEFIPGETGFLLHGDVGTGKTHLLAAVVRKLTLEKGYNCRFVEFTHLLGELREQFDQGRGESEILQPLAEIPVLAIDELGKGQNTEWQLSIIDQIISKRYNRDLTTLFTTNYPLTSDHRDSGSSGASSGMPARATEKTLRECIGERIFSRLHEMAEFVHLDAPDYRQHDR